MSDQLYYSDYLKLDKLLGAMEPVTRAHDEKLFITVHQAYEVWFQQILFELDELISIFSKEYIDDDSDDMPNALRLLTRIVEIWKILISQVDVLETMTPLDFFDFRKSLGAASGFQSLQFKLIEAKLGLPMSLRHDGTHYKHTNEGGLSRPDLAQLEKTEEAATLRAGVIKWLSRLDATFAELRLYSDMWKSYANIYNSVLSPADREELSEAFKRNFIEDTGNAEFPASAHRAGLIITAFRDYPLLRDPFAILTKFIEIDEYMSIWRFRHMLLVNRMIGARVGTGGRSKKYLEGVLKQHRVFAELADLSTFLIDRTSLKKLLEPYDEEGMFGRLIFKHKLENQSSPQPSPRI